jgi:hypothetical protein
MIYLSTLKSTHTRNTHEKILYPTSLHDIAYYRAAYNICGCLVLYRNRPGRSQPIAYIHYDTCPNYNHSASDRDAAPHAWRHQRHRFMGTDHRHHHHVRTSIFRPQPSPSQIKKSPPLGGDFHNVIRPRRVPSRTASVRLDAPSFV